MEGISRIWFTSKQRSELWGRWKGGECVADIARSLGRRNKSGVYRILALNGGIAPAPRQSALVVLRLEEREEISRGIAAGGSIRRIARGLGRSPSTISREIRRNGGCRAYRASQADRRAWERASRPKPCRLARHAALRWRVAQKLALQWSPEQISGWLKWQFPTDQGMHLSHEAIYRSLFIQTRGVLKKELTAYLRTARQMRQAKGGNTKSGRGQILDLVSIRERPAEVEDRAVHPLYDARQASKQGYGDCDSRDRQTRPQTASATAMLFDLGSRQGDGQPQALHRCHQGAGLLLRSTQSLATRQQREHQRLAATVLPQRNRPPAAQSTSAKDLGL